MKTEVILAVVLAPSPLRAGAEGSDWRKDYHTLLKKYVVGGGVRYAACKANGADVAALGKVVGQ